MFPQLYLYFFPEELLPVVKATEVLVLPQQLDGRLRAIGIQLGHVEIINEDDDTFASRSA